MYTSVLFIMLYELKIKVRDEIRVVKQTIYTFYTQHIIIVYSIYTLSDGYIHIV